MCGMSAMVFGDVPLSSSNRGGVTVPPQTVHCCAPHPVQAVAAGERIAYAGKAEPKSEARLLHASELSGGEERLFGWVNRESYIMVNRGPLHSAWLTP